VKETVVPGGTGNGSSDLNLVPVTRYILFSFLPVNCLCLVLFIYLLLLHFGQKQTNTMVHCCISGCAGRSKTISQLPYSQDANHRRTHVRKTRSEM